MKDEEKKKIAVWAKLIRVQQILLDAVEKDLKNSGFPPLGWYDVLLELNREPDKSLRLNELGNRILLAKNNVTRLVDRLEKEKLVKRTKCASDGRGVFAQITPKGQKLLKEMWPIYRQSIRSHFGQYLDVAETNQLIDTLSKFDSRAL